MPEYFLTVDFSNKQPYENELSLVQGYLFRELPGSKPNLHSPPSLHCVFLKEHISNGHLSWLEILDRHPFIRLRQNTLQLAAGMNGGANAPKLEERPSSAVALLRRMERRVGFCEFRFDTPQFAAGRFIGFQFIGGSKTTPSGGIGSFLLTLVSVLYAAETFLDTELGYRGSHGSGISLLRFPELRSSGQASFPVAYCNLQKAD